MLQERVVLCGGKVGRRLRDTVIEHELPYEPWQLFCLNSEGVC
jgi:hypothetical protein